RAGSLEANSIIASAPSASAIKRYDLPNLFWSLPYVGRLFMDSGNTKVDM
ncbi:MAG: hypothetical protein HOC61_03140, partial [Rhodobacterales bacterium]|nr:hypothetical protein [Rhodobacterales bacterium]